MTKRSAGTIRTVAAAAGGFLAGMVAMAVAVWLFPTVTQSGDSAEPSRSDWVLADEQPNPVVDAGGRGERTESRRSSLDSPPPIAPPLPRSPTATPMIDADPVSELRERELELPVRGAVRQELHDSFDDVRAPSHRHEAIDIMAPRNTPILAVEDGTIARLFASKPGGNTVYQFDPTTRYVYYYAHLERYADGILEGHQVQRGQVLGYVGTSGNAPKDTPHLHFAIFRLTEKKQWWQGSSIDPYSVFK